MPRLCDRPGCAAPAVVTFTFEPAALTVWVADLLEDPTGPGHDLCETHGGRLSAPRGWTLADQRTVRPVVPALDAQSPMLSRAFRSAAG
jgi:Protein of unknown function (DUF3499)